MLLNIQDLIDEEKWYAVVREMRWPDGVKCPHCGSAAITKRGFHNEQAHRQRYECQACRRQFDDLTGTIFEGHHQPLRVWVLCLYFMGLNLSTRITDNFRVGAQVYDRNLGQLGQWHPSLDWAVADYRFTAWLGIRGGQVKTVLGLYNDTQDQDFLHTFALLPQSAYPADLRDATIAHLGSDIYGRIPLQHQLGDLSYTAYAGHRSDSIYSGYPYLISQFGTLLKTLGGLPYGGDLRWNTPVRGLLVGASRLNQDTTGKGRGVNPLNPGAGVVPYSESSKADWTNQFYGEYTIGKLQIDSEYRR